MEDFVRIVQRMPKFAFRTMPKTFNTSGLSLAHRQPSFLQELSVCSRFLQISLRPILEKWSGNRFVSTVHRRSIEKQNLTVYS